MWQPCTPSHATKPVRRVSSMTYEDTVTLPTLERDLEVIRDARGRARAAERGGALAASPHEKRSRAHPELIGALRCADRWASPKEGETLSSD